MKTADAVVSVRLNGHRVVDQQAVKKTTPHGTKGGKKPTGPVWIEGFGRRVLYRNIWVLERPEGGDREKQRTSEERSAWVSPRKSREQPRRCPGHSFPLSTESGTAVDAAPCTGLCSGQ